VTNPGVVTRDDGTIGVSGALTFETVPAYYAASNGWLSGGAGALTVDLHGVTRVDSAGVALLLEWLARARAGGHALAFVNLPEQVQHMIRVSGLNQAFGINNHG
jgi:phospholipid transport system transporter-binding protein